MYYLNFLILIIMMMIMMMMMMLIIKIIIIIKLIPWHAVRSLIWDVTMSYTTADSYLEACSGETVAAAEFAASNRVVIYGGLSSQGEFVPTAVKSHGPVNSDALQL